MLIRRSAKMLAENVDCAWPGSKKNLALRKTALESTLPPHNDGAGHRVSERIESKHIRCYYLVEVLTQEQKATHRPTKGHRGSNAMKYLLLKRRPQKEIAEENVFLEEVSAMEAIEPDPRLPFTIETHDLDDAQAADMRDDPRIEDVISSIPLTLIAPLEDSGSGTAAANNAWGIAAVGADTSPQNGNGVTAAILDTGIDKGHAAFAGMSFRDEDLMDFTSNEEGLAGSAPDVHGHGTHVAGTIFGRDMTGTRIGVARGVTRVLIAKVLGPNGGPTETIVNAIEWALRRRADIISMSLGIDFMDLWKRLQDGGLPGDIALSRALEAYRSNVRLFDRLASEVQARVERGRGALLVAASGNESRRKQNQKFTAAVAPPAAADGFIPVGAVGQNPLAVAGFSNTSCQVCAPGVDILSAKLGGGLKTLSGTSMATPHVAGVLALWTQKLFPSGERPPKWTADVQRELEAHVKPVPGGARIDVGLGMVQAPQP
jgi:subtilisin family serine protease